MSEAYAGEIRMFLGAYVPDGWLACDGSVVDADKYSELLHVIGYTYGSTGNPQTFKLPDLRGRSPVGVGMQPTTQVPFALGKAGGAEAVVLTPGQMPSHTHGVLVQGPNGKPAATEIQTRGCPAVAKRPSEVQPTGAGLPVPILPPFVGVQFIICWDGAVPGG